MPRGGKREGAGRKLGALTVRTRKIAEQAAAEGKNPLEVMLENMRHFQKLALDAEATLAGLTLEEFVGKHGADLTPSDQFKALLAEVKKTAGLRQAAQECARDAAPFLHPRLANVQHSGDQNNPVKVVNRIERVFIDQADGPDAADTDAEGVPTAH